MNDEHPANVDVLQLDAARERLSALPPVDSARLRQQRHVETRLLVSGPRTNPWYVVHGIGMCNEYPQVAPLKWFEQTGYDGEFEPNMTVSVESYIGERGAKEGVRWSLTRLR